MSLRDFWVVHRRGKTKCKEIQHIWTKCKKLASWAQLRTCWILVPSYQGCKKLVPTGCKKKVRVS